MGSKKQVHSLGINTGSTAYGQLTAPCQKLTPSFRWLGRSYSFRFHSCQSAVCNLPHVKVSCFCGFTNITLTSLLIILPSSQIYSRSSALCLGVNLCFHHLINEGSVIALKEIINFIIGEGYLW